MFVSLIIPTRNRREHVRRAVGALLEQSYDSSSFEIIVCCDGCTDGTEADLGTVADNRLSVLSIAATGQVAALNFAIARARGEIGIFLDDEMEADRNLIRTHVAAHLQSPEKLSAITVFASVVLPSSASPLIRQEAVDFAEYIRALGDSDRKFGPGDLNGGHFSIPLAQLREVGCFNDGYVFLRNDFELATRWIERGYAIRYAPEAKAKMHICVTSKTLVARVRPSARADYRLALEHPWCIPWLPFRRALKKGRLSYRWWTLWNAAPIAAPMAGFVRRFMPDNPFIYRLHYFSEYCYGLRPASGGWARFRSIESQQSSTLQRTS